MSEADMGEIAGLGSMALFGKTAASLLLVLALILIGAWLLRRFNPQTHRHSPHLSIVSSMMVGPRERVVIVSVNNTWLVLGVSAGHVHTLHKLPAPANSATDKPTDAVADSFIKQLAVAVKARNS